MEDLKRLASAELMPYDTVKKRLDTGRITEDECETTLAIIPEVMSNTKENRHGELNEGSQARPHPWEKKSGRWECPWQSSNPSSRCLSIRPWGKQRGKTMPQSFLRKNAGRKSAHPKWFFSSFARPNSSCFRRVYYQQKKKKGKERLYRGGHFDAMAIHFFGYFSALDVSSQTRVWFCSPHRFKFHLPADGF